MRTVSLFVLLAMLFNFSPSQAEASKSSSEQGKPITAEKPKEENEKEAADFLDKLRASLQKKEEAYRKNPDIVSRYERDVTKENLEVTESVQKILKSDAVFCKDAKGETECLRNFVEAHPPKSYLAAVLCISPGVAVVDSDVSKGVIPAIRKELAAAENMLMVYEHTKALNFFEASYAANDPNEKKWMASIKADAALKMASIRQTTVKEVGNLLKTSQPKINAEKNVASRSELKNKFNELVRRAKDLPEIK